MILILIIVILKPTKDNSKNDYDKFWINKTFAQAKYDIVIIGDSRVYRGISPNEIKKYFPDKEILNFGYSSARLSNILFRQSINKFSPDCKEKTIIIGVTPNSLITEVNENQHLMENLNMPREKRYEILYFNNFLKHFEVIKGRDFKQKDTTAPKYIQEYKENGWVASNKLPEDTIEAIDSYRPWFAENNVSYELINNLLIHIKTWTKQDIKVYGFYMPTSWSMKQLEDSLSGFDQNQFANKFTKAGGKWLNFNNKKYHSFDGSHLDKKSAIEFSNDLANEILKQKK
jgi:hypothetical protein